MRSLAHPTGNRRVTPGDLTALITFEAETRTPDGYAGGTQAWAEVRQAWAFAEPLFVGEREQIGAVRNVVQYRFTIYRQDGLTEQMRIRWNGATHTIKGFRTGGPTELFMEVITETGLGD